MAVIFSLCLQVGLATRTVRTEPSISDQDHFVFNFTQDGNQLSVNSVTVDFDATFISYPLNKKDVLDDKSLSNEDVAAKLTDE